MTTQKDLKDVEVFEAMLNSYTEPHQQVKNHLETNLVEQSQMIAEA